jgi:hypothetical protein
MLPLYLISVFSLSKAMQNVFICSNYRLDSPSVTPVGIATGFYSSQNGPDHYWNHFQSLNDTEGMATTPLHFNIEYLCIRFANLEKIIISNDETFVVFSNMTTFIPHGTDEYQGMKNKVNANSSIENQIAHRDTFTYYNEIKRDELSFMIDELARAFRIWAFALSYRLRSFVNKLKMVLGAQYWVLDVFNGMKYALFYSFMLMGAYMITSFEFTRSKRYQALGLVVGCIYCERLLLSYSIVGCNEILCIRLLFGVFIVFTMAEAINSFKRGRKVPISMRQSAEDIINNEYISVEDTMQESISVKSESEFSTGH